MWIYGICSRYIVTIGRMHLKYDGYADIQKNITNFDPMPTAILK